MTVIYTVYSGPDGAYGIASTENVTISANYTVNPNDYIITATGAGGFIISLPKASLNGNRNIIVKCLTTASITLNAYSGDLIDLVTSRVVSNGEVVDIISDGTSKWIETESSTISGSKLLNGTVTEAKIADGAITVNKIGTGAVTEAKIGTGAVTETKIADSSVTVNKIGTGAVTETKIGSSAVTEAKIGTGAVTETKIADSSITVNKIGTGAVTETKIGSSAVTEAKIADGAITVNKIGTNAVIETKIADSSITVNKIGTGAVTEAKIGTSAVTETKIGAGAVTETKIANNAVTAAKIATGAVGNDEINTSASPTVNTIYTNHWFRSNGSTGWYNETHQGGIFMEDSNYVKVYNGKAFMPTAGSGTNGIIFPLDPGGGSGDVASIKYYQYSGEDCELRIEVANDAKDRITISSTNGYIRQGEYTEIVNTALPVSIVGRRGAGGQTSTIIYSPAENYASSWPSGWGGGLATWDIICASIQGNIVNTSDKRIKEQIIPIDDAIQTVMKFRPVSFYWTKDYNSSLKNQQFGFIAQEVETFMPELVIQGGYDEIKKQEGYKSLNYIGIIPFLTKAVQEQQQKIDLLEERIKKLEELIKS